MRLKSYFVHTMEEALRAAKTELGDEAMLVDSKRLAAPLGGRARLEVIFALAAPAAPPVVEPAAPLAAACSCAGLQRFRGELRVLLDALSRRPDGSRLEMLSPARPQLDRLLSQLLQAEVPCAVADETVERCRAILEALALRGNLDQREAEEAVLPLLAAEWPHPLEPEATAEKVLIFAGPAGAGKTSAVAKLAFRLGVSRGQPVSVIAVDNVRVGASEQLAHICSLLGVPFQSVDYGGALAAAVTAHGRRGLLLIDTPGFGSSDGDILADTARNTTRVASAICHLVLPATMRYVEMQRRHREYLPFAPSRLLFTRLDETEYFGPAWAFCKTTGLAADWCSTGPRIPEDIEEADAACISAALLGRTPYASTTQLRSSSLASAAGAGASRI